MDIQYVCKNFQELNLQELYRIMQIRNEVFYVEQRCNDLDLDDRDQMSLHLCMLDKDIIWGYARLLPPGLSYPEMSIGRVASIVSYRGKGLGNRLMQIAIEQCYVHFGNGPIKISAQLYLKKFYESLGFQQQSETYLEAGIEHVKMLKTYP